MQDVRRQVLHQHQRCINVFIHPVLDLDAILHGDMKVSRRHDGSLAKIAIHIRELDHGHLGADEKLLAHDPLRPAAARTQHEDGGHLIHDLVVKLAGSVENHAITSFLTADEQPESLRK